MKYNYQTYDKSELYGIVTILILALVLGIYSIFSAIKLVWNTTDTKNWKKVTANIESINFISEECNTGSTKCEEVVISYNYKIGKIKYQGNKIAYGYSRNSVNNHRKIFQMLKYAYKVEAYIDPNNYSKSVLIRNLKQSTSFIIMFSVIFNSLVIGLAYLSLIGTNKRRKETSILFGVLGIWILIISLYSSNLSKTDLKKELIILERKSQIEIDKIEREEIEKAIEEYEKQEKTISNNSYK